VRALTALLIRGSHRNFSRGKGELELERSRTGETRNKQNPSLLQGKDGDSFRVVVESLSTPSGESSIVDPSGAPPDPILVGTSIGILWRSTTYIRSNLISRAHN